MRARGHVEVRYLGEDANPAPRIADDSAAGDLIVTLGAGDVYRIGEAVLAVLDAEAQSDERV
jgi:UDP-N-acetylmuramate-alanine ligase